LSLCQPEHSSLACVSCCGIFNLRLSLKNILLLLNQRTSSFKETGLQKSSIIRYRELQEQQESIIKRFDSEIYVCPFLGYLHESKPGCMIHPQITQKQQSQNYSFYGAAICQSYNCRNKDSALDWSVVFQKASTDWIEYSRLSGYHLQTNKIINKFKISKQADIESLQSALVQECRQWLQGNKNLPVTSFEIYDP